MEVDVAFDPVQIGLLGAQAVVFATDRVTDLVEQARTKMLGGLMNNRHGGSPGNVRFAPNIHSSGRTQHAASTAQSATSWKNVALQSDISVGQ